MSTAEHRRGWEDLAVLDPMWAVLSDPQRQFGRWNADEFFSTGAEEVARLRERLLALGYPDTFGSALDFGCGLGRLTRALTACCREVIGVDISEEMISKARALTPACQFVHNQNYDLRIFPSNRFDLIYTRFVLQHQRSTKLILEYVSELIRVVKPGGVAAFQIPCNIPYAQRIQPRRRAYDLLRAVGLPAGLLYRMRLNPICMTSASVKSVMAAVEASGGRVLAVNEDDACRGVDSRLYCATK